MKSLWTKFLTGFAVAGMLMTAATVSAGGHKGFSFGGGGGSNSMRSHSGSNSGSQSMSSFARSLSGNNNGGNNNGGNHNNGNHSNSNSFKNLSQNQFKAHSQGNNNQFSNLSKALKSHDRPNLGSLGNSNQFKSMERLGKGQNNAFDQMLRGAQAFHGNHGSNKSQGLQTLMGGQSGNKGFNPAKLHGSNHQNDFFAGLGKHDNHSNKSNFFADHHHDHHDHSHHDHHGHHHHNNFWWGWNDPWCYQPNYYNSYPTYGSYPYYNSSVAYGAPVTTTPTAAAPTPLAPQLPLADLVLTDLRVMEPGNGTDQGPLFQITIANQGPSASPPFQTTIVAAATKEQLDAAVKAEVQVGPIQPGQTTQVEVRLPIEAMALPGPNGPTMFGVLGVALDDMNQVDELDEQNNRGLVNRDNIRPLEGASAPQTTANPAFASSGSNVPGMLSLPQQ